MLLSMSIASFWPRPQEEGTRQRHHHHHDGSSKNNKSKKFSSTTSATSPAAQEETSLVFYQRYPILTLCIVVTLIGFAIVTLIAANGWDGASITSNCYQDYLTQADCFCEKLYGSKPGDVWIAQPMNTITNLWFVLVGFWIASVADSNYQTCLLHIPNWVLLLPPSSPSSTTASHSSNSSKKKKKNNLMTQDKLYATVIALVACLLGVGSTALHASFTNWGRQADMIAMYLLATYMVLYPMLRSQLITKIGTVWSYLISNSALIYWVTQASTEPEHARTVFTTLIVLSIVVELQTSNNDKSKKWIKANRKARRVHMALGLMFALSLVQWKLSSSGGPLCDPDSLWQGHSLWHFTSAIGIGMIFLYYLYEEPINDEESNNTTTTESSSIPNRNRNRNKNKNKDESQPPQAIRLVDNNNKKARNVETNIALDDIPKDIDSILENPVLGSVQFLHGLSLSSFNNNGGGGESAFEHSNSSSSNDTGTEDEEDDDNDNDVWSESSSSGK